MRGSTESGSTERKQGREREEVERKIRQEREREERKERGINILGEEGKDRVLYFSMFNKGREEVEIERAVDVGGDAAEEGDEGEEEVVGKEEKEANCTWKSLKKQTGKN